MPCEWRLRLQCFIRQVRRDFSSSSSKNTGVAEIYVFSANAGCWQYRAPARHCACALWGYRIGFRLSHSRFTVRLVSVHVCCRQQRQLEERKCVLDGTCGGCRACLCVRACVCMCMSVRACVLALICITFACTSQCDSDDADVTSSPWYWIVRVQLAVVAQYVPKALQLGAIFFCNIYKLAFLQKLSVVQFAQVCRRWVSDSNANMLLRDTHMLRDCTDI